MHGLMSQQPLVMTSILRYAQTIYADVEVVSVTVSQPRHRTSYGECFDRAARFATALAGLGVSDGECVATLAWNDHRHFEAYYAIPCMGAVCHTVNPRLFAEQIVYILNHAEDRYILTDPMFVPLLEAVWPHLESAVCAIVLCDADAMPQSDTVPLQCYEVLLEQADGPYAWPDLDENAASSLCYTSGTTGHPKGVLYSHRSNLIHALSGIQPNVFGLSQNDCILPVVPMFHANGWGVPYAAPMVGAKLVLPGPRLADGATLHALMEEERVTLALGVPTVWLALLEWLRAHDQTLTTVNRTIVGGAACPQSIMDEFQQRHGVYVHHAWGMTETSPLGTFNSPPPDAAGLSDEQKSALRVHQGRPPFGIELRIDGPDGTPLPWDGKQAGTLKVRGPWVCSGYFKLDNSSAHEADDWFNTGDVANIDANGYMQITDREKDVIKSGGEWISSIDLENTAVAHPDVAEAAAIGIAHPKWTERPLLLVVPVAGTSLSREDMLAWFDGKVAKWWIPEDVVFVDELPHTATGKLQKLALRERFADHYSTES